LLPQLQLRSSVPSTVSTLARLGGLQVSPDTLSFATTSSSYPLVSIGTFPPSFMNLTCSQVRDILHSDNLIVRTGLITCVRSSTRPAKSNSPRASLLRSGSDASSEALPAFFCAVTVSPFLFALDGFPSERFFLLSPIHFFLRVKGGVCEVVVFERFPPWLAQVSVDLPPFFPYFFQSVIFTCGRRTTPFPPFFFELFLANSFSLLGAL